jgi:hypothetical protein
LHKLSPLTFVEFALQRDYALERVAPAIGATVVRHRDLEMREWVLPLPGVKADRHRCAGRKRRAQEFVGVGARSRATHFEL